MGGNRHDDTVWLWLWVLMRMCKSAHCKCLQVCVCMRVGAATLCSRAQLLYCGARAVWVRMGQGRKWRQMNREELNTLAVSSMLLILQARLFFLLLFFLLSLLPSLSLRKYYKATQKDSRHSNENRKSVALFVLLSRHRQLIPQWRLTKACGAIIPTLKPAVHGRCIYIWVFVRHVFLLHS